MTKYRLAALVKEENLTAVIAAMMAAGMNQHLDTEILITEAVKERNPETIAEIAHGLHPAPAPVTKPAPKARAKRGNGGEWPAEGSIYSVVMKALDNGAMTPSELRDVLKEGGFSPGSLGSALGRLEKQKKALRLDDGRWGPL
jgi:hypothetical protein